MALRSLRTVARAQRLIDVRRAFPFGPGTFAGIVDAKGKSACLKLKKQGSFQLNAPCYLSPATSDG
jgi:hypothetical protein